MKASIADLSPRSLDDMMRRVVSAWDQAPWDGRKSASFRLYQAAERAWAVGNDTECIRRLDAALRALN